MRESKQHQNQRILKINKKHGRHEEKAQENKTLKKNKK